MSPSQDCTQAGNMDTSGIEAMSRNRMFLNYNENNNLQED
jgi:hypothetical protein